MTVTIHNVSKSNLKAAEVEAWRPVPVAIAVDLARNGGQIDPAIRPLKPPGQQQSLFGRAVTALCEPPDFGAVIHALDLVGQGEVLVIAAAGNRDFAMIGEILSGHLRGRGCVGVVCDGAVRDVATRCQLVRFFGVHPLHHAARARRPPNAAPSIGRLSSGVPWSRPAISSSATATVWSP